MIAQSPLWTSTSASPVSTTLAGISLPRYTIFTEVIVARPGGRLRP
jgi:hypothetical protein